MFFQRLWQWLCGWVLFEAEGGAAGRFLSLAAREHIALWDTHRSGVLLRARCRAADYRRLRAPARRSGLRLHLCERHGAVFVLRRYHARGGLLVGLAVYALVLVWLSGHIWVVEIHGLSHGDEPALRTFLSAQGVDVGASKRAIEPEAIQLAALQQMEDISWLAVNLEGCVAKIEVRETDRNPAALPADTPSNLVASRDGRILSVQITGGEATVQAGDAVVKGSLLASGITATERETLLRRSGGVVLAETQHEITLTVPLTETVRLPAGPSRETVTLSLFGRYLPLSDDSLSTADCQVETCDRPVTIGGMVLPLGLHLRRLTPLTEQTVTRTPAQAEQEAYRRLGEEEARILGDTPVAERTVQILHDDSAVTLQAVYRCVENIACEVPLQVDAADTVPTGADS